MSKRRLESSGTDPVLAWSLFPQMAMDLPESVKGPTNNALL